MFSLPSDSSWRLCLYFSTAIKSRLGVSAFSVVVALVAASFCQAAVRVEAYRGEPFGIGRVTIDLAPGSSTAPASDDRCTVVEQQDRVLYPVVENKSSRKILRSLLGIEKPRRVTFLFMFRGDEPLELTAYTPAPQSFTARPTDNPQEFNKLLDDWWEATKNNYQQVFRSAEYPAVVNNYLTTTWARRLDRQMPEPQRVLFQRFRLTEPWLSQLLANEEYQTQLERDLLLGQFAPNEAATIPLPKQATVNLAPTGGQTVSGASTLPSPASAIEPLASHVPHECFYLRFGNFTNYLWYRDFKRYWQGDLGNMLVNQSVDHENNARLQQQLGVGESKISRVMGPTVVHDVAIIGLDPYMSNGAAMGILFHANNSTLLGSSLSKQRQDAKNSRKNAVEETVRIADRDISFIYTPDGQIRSFYATDGDYHLVTTSRRLVERFFEAGAGKDSLAASAEFTDCRAAMPLTREDTIFLFAPAAFFQNLAGPHYRVELDRRLRSIGEMRALTLARLAAKAEGRSAASIDELIAAELLPEGFAQRSDGSKLVDSGDGFRDSLRGQPGRMTPIPDMPVENITQSEARRLAAFQQKMQGAVGGFAPVAIAIKRTDSPTHKGWDQINAEVRIAPFSQMPIARWPNMLGPAATTRVAPIKGDVVSLEVVLGALGEPMHLFGGLRDFSPPLIVRQGAVTANQSPTEFIRAYIGGFPKPHLIDRFIRLPDGPLDGDNIGRTGGLFDLWFRRADDFFLLSFKRDILQEVGSQLAMVEAQHPAQIRLFVDDLSDKQLATAVTGFGYMRARDTSASASRFMNSLTTQLHVDPEKARPLAESLVTGRFVCPLGGDYVLVDANLPAPAPGQKQDEALPTPNGAAATATTSGRRLWASTATPPANRFLLTEIPADYEMPLMKWFRGLSAEAGRANDELTLHAKLEMVHLDVGPPEDPDAGGGGLSLPNLGNLFGFGGKKDENVKPAAATEQAKPAKQ